MNFTRIVALFFTLAVPCAVFAQRVKKPVAKPITPTAQPKAKVKVTSAKVPRELILQMANDYEEVKSSLQEQGGNIIKFSSKNFSTKLYDLNRDGRPEWFIEGASPNFCGNRVCSEWIYREVSGKYELLLEGGVPLGTYTNGYEDLMQGYGPYVPTIFTYDGEQYREGYDYTLDDIIESSNLDEIKNWVCKESKKRLVRAKNSYRKDDKENSWYEKSMLDVSFEDGWQEKMKIGCEQIQLEKFKVSNKGISIYYDTTIGFPMAILNMEPSPEYFYSWAILKPFLKPSSPISNLVK